MHKLAIIAAAAATILCAGPLSTNQAAAAGFGTAAGMRAATENLSSVDNVRCWWRYGHRHCHHHCWWRYGHRHCHW